jgi:hypothetical protein
MFAVGIGLDVEIFVLSGCLLWDDKIIIFDNKVS